MKHQFTIDFDDAVTGCLDEMAETLTYQIAAFYDGTASMNLNQLNDLAKALIDLYDFRLKQFTGEPVFCNYDRFIEALKEVSVEMMIAER